MAESELIQVVKLAEKSLLGAILIDSSNGSTMIVDYAKFRIKPDYFLDSKLWDNRNSRIYKAMLECKSPNQIAVAKKLNEMKMLKSGDCAYLRELVADCPTIYVYQDCIKVILESAIQRGVIKEAIGTNSYKGLRFERA